LSGVYLGMFEQSILAGENAASKTRALAASLGLQTMIVAIAVLIPLIATDRLPKIPLFATLIPPLRAQPEPPPVKATPSTATTSIWRSPAHPFTMPTNYSHPIVSGGPMILTDAGLSSADAVPSIAGAIGGIESHLPAIMPTVAPKPIAKPVDSVPAAPHPVSSGVQAANLIRKVMPVYPQMAKLAHVEGTVKLTGVIAKDDTVERLDVISGSPLLVKAALDAVRQWIYRPTLLSGEPVEVITEIDVNFTLWR